MLILDRVQLDADIRSNDSKQDAARQEPTARVVSPTIGQNPIPANIPFGSILLKNSISGTDQNISPEVSVLFRFEKPPASGEITT